MAGFGGGFRFNPVKTEKQTLKTITMNTPRLTNVTHPDDPIGRSATYWRSKTNDHAKKYRQLALLGLSALILQLPASAFATSVVTQWNDQALQSIRDTHPGPPIVARMLAVMHTCGYDAWAAYDAKAIGTQLGDTLRRPPAERTEGNKAKAFSFGAYRALLDLFPQTDQQTNIRNLMISLGYDPDDDSTDTTTPAGIGNVAAAAVLEFRHGDGSNQLGDLNPGPYTDYTGYVPVNTPDEIIDPTHWQPLRVSDGMGGFIVQSFIAPFWGLVTPFALTSGPQFLPVAPAPLSDAEYVEQANEVLSYSASLNDQQKEIAEYWADGPSSELPPGHWTLFAEFVSARDSYGIDDDSKLFFSVTNAIFDASIAAWQAKRKSDYVRPITAIHYLYTGTQVLAWAGPGLGTQLIDGGDWQPYQAVTVVTPPFPEFISGHSAFSAAGAQILRYYTGSDVFGDSVTFLAGSSRVEPGITPAHDLTLTWATFTDAADEAGISRRYGGIHFPQGDLLGRQMGRLVADQAWAKANAYFNPKASHIVPRVTSFVNYLNLKQKQIFSRTKQLQDFEATLPGAH